MQIKTKILQRRKQKIIAYITGVKNNINPFSLDMALKLSASTEKEAKVEAGFNVLHMTHEIYYPYFEIYERKKRMIKHTREWGEL